MTYFFEIVFILLALFDVWFTQKRLSESGLEAELNPLIRYLARKLGLLQGVATGVLGPTALLAIVGAFVPTILAFVLGVRFTLFLFQQKAQSDSK